MAEGQSKQDILAQAAAAFAAGDARKAADMLELALMSHHDDAELTSALAYALSRLDRLDVAADRFDEAARLRSNDFAVLRDAGSVNLKAGRLETALTHFRAAYRASNNDLALLGRVVDVLLRLKRADQALTLIDGTLALAPRVALLHYLRGVVLGAKSQHRDEKAAYEAALGLNPRLVDAHTNLGVLARDEQRFQDALRHFKQALAIDSDHAGARNNRAQTNLLLGQYTHGWRDYEWRWRDGVQTMPFSGAPWLGESSLKGKTLLVHAEQGLGDTLQFSRYVPALAEQADRVVFLVQPPLQTLLEANLPGVTVISQDDEIPVYDLHTPLLSLPLALSRQRAEPWPLTHALQADAARTQAWAERLGPKGVRPRIGLAWSGNASHSDDHNRSIPFELLSPVLDVSADFVSLQKDVRDEDLAAIDRWRAQNPAATLRLTGADLNDFADSAALAANLDLVITVDTSAAHLAGSLGRPTWLLLPTMPDWRWQLNRSDTPWYPSMTLYRRGQDWSELLQVLQEKLRAGLDFSPDPLATPAG
ncbi:tetratricopeptide repeat protein [Achromobacter mucicolens]|uniref:tetratricopeptide repeat protein n=1 Tax=Achromobacter mucicolens TaxID=1389922 RepID=UPI0024493EF0|nr:tetratricopeptide repeat protein [Achromobacter mucicolens]MDH0094140.1 tetratricopeptide repeat protein [Achromobacter mucicolens]